MLDYNNAELEDMRAIAQDPSTPADVLQQLSENSDRSIRLLVASNPNTPTEVLLKLGEHFPEAITANPIFNLLLLEYPNSKFVRLSLARSSTTSEETLARLSQTQQPEDEEICCAIAKNISTPIHILEKLADWYPINNGYQDEYSASIVHKCVALNPKTPSSLLEKLAFYRSSGVREAVAKHQNTSSNVLDKLARNRNREVCEAIANNPNTPASALEYLAGEQDFAGTIRRAVLAHPNVSTAAIEIVRFMEEKPGTPVHILEKLTDDSRLHVRQLVADHPHTPPHALKTLAKDTDYRIRYCVAMHQNTPTEVMEELINQLVDEHKQTSQFSTIYGEELENFTTLIKLPRITTKALLKLAYLNIPEIIEAIAKSPKTPPSVIEKLADYQTIRGNSIHFWGTLSENPNTPSKVLEQIFTLLQPTFKHPNAGEYLVNVASHQNLPVNLVEELALNKNSRLRAAIGRNPSTPVHILRKLAEDPNITVLKAVAQNSNTPVDILIRFVVNPDFLVRMSLASNVKAPIVILESLVNDELELVRANLAKNVSAPIFILERLAQDPDESVREGVTENSQTPASLLELLVNTWSDKTRANIAKHSNSGAETLMKLAEDKSSCVRASLLENNNISEAIIEKILGATLTKIQQQTKDIYGEVCILCKIARHPNTSSLMLEKLALNLCDRIRWNLGSNLVDVQEAIASNINTPISVLEDLANDSFEITQRTARKTLKAKVYVSK
ncbi:MAG TPA: hypothetical protein DCY88_22020 [Cyanobacteria bacterium UBA11372]|nr:hypothetical protein [Cyanobacteria bacterium UBA11372]